eukprot:gene31177-37681_t
MSAEPETAVSDLFQQAYGVCRDEALVLPGKDSVYLDNAACPLVALPLLQEIHKAMSTICLRNPHSVANTDDYVSETRKLTLDHFSLDENDYMVVFTSGATGSMKLIGDMFPWSPESIFAYPSNAHNSLMDAAKLAGTSKVEIKCTCGKNPDSDLPCMCLPDFIVVSYYKIFGMPTGLGACLIKNSIHNLLRKKYFGGGTIQQGYAYKAWCVPKPSNIHSHYEDGTQNFQGIMMAKCGFQFIRTLGVYNESSYTNAYSSAKQGGVVVFNVCYSDGSPVGHTQVLKLAEKKEIYFRTGCFCNLGACHEALGLSAADVAQQYAQGKVCAGQHDEVLDVIDQKHTGACRVSLGYCNTFKDVDVLVAFIQGTYVDQLPIHVRLQTPSMPASLTSKTTHAGENGYTDVEKLFFQQEICTFPWQADKAPSLLSNEHNSSSSIKLHAAIIYPVKSCAGIRVNMWPVTLHGLLFDRLLSVVQTRTHPSSAEPSYTILTQKTCPRLALLQCRIYYSRDSCGSSGTSDYQDENGLWILQLSCPSYRNGNALEVILHEGSRVHSQLPSDGNVPSDVASAAIKVRVCGRCEYTSLVSTAGAGNGGDILSEWLTGFVHEGMPPEKRMYTYTLLRTCSADSQMSKGKDQPTVRSFVNTAQYLLLSTTSVHSLIQMIQQVHAEDSEKTGLDVDNIYVENFRPNLVIHPTQPHSHAHLEDQFGAFQFNVYCPSQADSKSDRITLTSTGPCARCMMVNIDHRHGTLQNTVVYEVLQAYRQKSGANVVFGQFLTYSDSEEDSVASSALSSDNIWLLPRLVMDSDVKTVDSK